MPCAVVRRALLCALALLAVAALFLMAGCKYSDVLTQHIEDPDLGTLDENVDPVYESNPDAELILDLAELSLDEADDENTQVQALPHYDPEAPDNGPTKQRVKSNETPHDEEASEGTEQEGEADREGKGEGKQGGKSASTAEGDQGDGDPSEDGDSDGSLTSDEVENPSEQSSDGGGGGDTVVVDPDDGTNADTAKGTVAAVGEYATITQMLGGAGALAAADEAWLAARAADGCFTGELERVQVAFSGDGTTAGCCDVDALVNTIQPSVVLWDGKAPNLTDADRSKLEQAGITVQSVPLIGAQTTEDYTVTQSVQAVASVLQGASGLAYDPVDVASQYVSFHDKVLKTAYETNGGYSYKIADSTYDRLYQDTPLSGLSNSTTTRVTAVYVDDLMVAPVSSALVSQTASLADGTTFGLSHDGKVLDVSDGVGLSAATGTRGYMLLDYYLQLAGIVNNAYDTAQPESQGRRYIIMPGNTAAFGTTNNYASRTSSSALFYNSGDSTVKSNWHWLGAEDFPAVLVANDDIAQAFVKSAAKPDGLYRMEGSYRVIVVPTGIAGTWTEGHLDSFLMAMWSYGVKEESNLSRAAEWVEAFYRDYLRCPNWESNVANWNTSYAVSG